MQQITVGCALSQAWVDTELRASRKPELLASRLDSVRNRWQKERSCLIRYLLHKCEGPLGSPELMLNLMAYNLCWGGRTSRSMELPTLNE